MRCDEMFGISIQEVEHLGYTTKHQDLIRLTVEHVIIVPMRLLDHPLGVLHGRYRKTKRAGQGIQQNDQMKRQARLMSDESSDAKTIKCRWSEVIYLR
jgi:hypothetical protein